MKGIDKFAEGIAQIAADFTERVNQAIEEIKKENKNYELNKNAKEALENWKKREQESKETK